MVDFTGRGKTLAKQIIVNKPSDLSGELLSDTLYLVDGVIDMGSIQIIVPQGGLTIHGLDFQISKLMTSTAGTTLFIDDGVFSGSLYLRQLTVDVSGTGSQVFDLDNDGNFGAIELTNFNFENCLSLGVVDSYRQGLWNNFAVIGCTTGLTLSGTWSGGFAILTSIIVSAGTAFTGVLLQEGTSLSIEGSVRSDINALQLDSTGAICDFQPSNIANDAGFLMNGVRVNTDANAFPNMPPSSVKCRFTNCTGTLNTYVGGVSQITTGATTIITTTDVLTKMEGTASFSDLQWMVGDGGSDLKSISNQSFEISTTGALQFTGGNNDGMGLQVRKFDAALTSFVNVGPEYRTTLNGTGASDRPASITFFANATMNIDDRIEIWIKNLNDTTNIITLASGQIQVSER